MGRDFENRKHAIFRTAGIKSKVYSKYGKLIYATAKNGVPDPDGNPALRNLIDKAKKDQVPAHVIEKAIEKARGLGGEDFTTARFEAFGPGGSLLIVDCLTDNNQRTVSDIKSYFTKTGAKLGSAAMFFDQVAVLSFKGDNEDAVLEAMLNAEVDVEEVKAKDGYVTIFAPPSEFYKAKTALMAAFPKTELETQEITFLPQESKELSADDWPIFEKLFNMLNENDDVQNVYHNVKFPG